MHGLDNMIHMYINSSFCTCQSQVLYLLYLHLPFANTHVVKYHESSMHGTLAIFETCAAI